MASFVVHANLDCEARWSGIPLPEAVERRISLYGTLVAALAPRGEEVEVWTPAPVDPARVLLVPRPALRAGVPPRADLAWADPAARGANDRRLAHAVAALPGAQAIASPDELAIAGEWVAKSPWTAAGRDRCRGRGAPTPEQRARLARLLAHTGVLVVEPWCERILDAGVCATVDAGGRVTAQPPHGLLTDPRGGFVGIDLAPPALEPAERGALDDALVRTGAALAGAGYAGPFAIDAFAYRDAGGARRFHPLCEINARYSFGWITRALGVTRLGFTAPPPGATVLIAPADDGVTAWCA